MTRLLATKLQVVYHAYMYEKALTLLQEKGLRATKQRISLLSLLQTYHRPLTIQDIIGHLAHEMDAVTVYRILDVLKQNDVVREYVQEKKLCYEFSDHEHDHHHVICTKCHRTEDFVGCESDRIEKNALKQVKSFAMITAHSLELFGLCTRCAR